MLINNQNSLVILFFFNWNNSTIIQRLVQIRSRFYKPFVEYYYLFLFYISLLCFNNARLSRDIMGIDVLLLIVHIINLVFVILNSSIIF